jgi:hypothetical protein
MTAPVDFVYDGEFDLSFLRDGETVRSAGDGTGACWIEQPTGPGTSRGCRIEVGDVVQRLMNGAVIAYPLRNPDCHDQHGNPAWSCIEFDGTGLWCDSCLAWAERAARVPRGTTMCDPLGAVTTEVAATAGDPTCASRDSSAPGGTR